MSKNNPARRRKNPNGSGNISVRADGLYELKLFVNAADGTRKRISIYGATWEEADAERTRLKEMERQGIPVEITTMTVAEYMSYWLEEVVGPSIRRTTYATYRGDIRLHIAPALGKRKLKALSAQHVRTFINGLRTRCQCCAQGKDAARRKPRCCAKQSADCCGDVLSISSIRHVLRVLRAALQDAVDDEVLARNVARSVHVSGGAKSAGRRFTRAEAIHFLAAAAEHRLHALWAVALALGLRRGEALGLAWDDVDLAGGRITIRQALQRVDGRLQLTPVKTDGSNTTLPLPSPLVPILREHQRIQGEQRFAAGDEWRDSGLVFTTAVGGPIEPRNVNRMFARLCEQAGLPRLRVHDLRHSCATLLFTMGVDAATVQRILRHSSIGVTINTYTEVIEQVQRKAVDELNPLFRDSHDGSAGYAE
ncbi:site-specific integrase [Nocardia sp. NPDC050799]|uniref:tyrosine-type recombinase/integrase n=1 Tax=Nocardia sp. NPDC050799 TaxID=3154842 RepID=UPI0033D999E3